MLRTQVQITEQQDKLLEAIGRENRVSKAELIRRAVDLMLDRQSVGRSPEEQRERAIAVVGRFRAGKNSTARLHDETLAEVYRGER
ncbi:hypothetical protein BH23ACT11_BH23ACT11_21320 [soil metagenome]